MNRKLFNGLLLLTVATGGIGTFTSCKDTEQDFRNEVIIGQEDLSKQIAAIRNFDDATFKKNLQDYLDKQDYASAADLVKVWAAIDAANDRIDALDQAYKDADADLEQRLNEKYTTLFNELKDVLDAYMESNDDALQQLRDALDEVADTANDALEQALFNAGEIERLGGLISQLQSQYGELEGELGELADKVSDLEDKYSDLFDKLGALETSLDNRIDGLEENIENLRNEVNDMYSRLMDKFKKLVTSINVNEVDNAIFGSFRFPVGVSSKIIANYYGYSNHDAVFPPNPSMNHGMNIEYSTNPALDGLVKELEQIEAPFQMWMSADVVSLEKLADVYLTVNPGERNFDGLTLSLVNSKDEAVPALDELQLKKENNHIVKMGVTKSAEDNGFYKAAAEPRTSFNMEDIAGIRYDLEPGLKTAFKDAIKNHTKGDFAELAKVILKQLGQDMPAYAVKCEWKDTDVDAEGNEIEVTKSVRSDYELAVATFRPLSYSTGFDIHGNIELPTPTIGYIKDRIQAAFDKIYNELQLGIDDITVKDINISLEGVKVTVTADNITIDLSGLPIEVGGVEGNLADGAVVVLTVEGNGGIVDNPNEGALKPLVDAIQNAINDLIKGTGDDSLTAQINSQLQSQIQLIVDDINEQLRGVQGKINNALTEIETRINNELNGRFGRLAEDLLDLYNTLATKVNNFIKNPNAYLQVMMAYMGQDNQIHRLPTMESDPLRLQAGQNLELFATSYTAELIVPSYKKYVAVVDATDAQGNWGNFEAAKKANEYKNLNVVRPGYQQRFALDGSKLQKGLKYKIVYSSLDYQGYTSTQVYYIEVI